MKNINEIDTSQYSYYVYTDLVGDFDVKVPTLGGWVDVMNGYDIYATDSGSIVAFDSISVFGFHDAKFVKNGVERHVELKTYEELDDTFEEKEPFGLTFYIFAKSAEMPSTSVFNPNATIHGKPINQSTFARCDIGKYGAIPFELGENAYNIKNVFNVMNYSGLGHIVRIETSDSENKNINHHSIYTYGRTLEGTIKTAYEWSVVAQDPFNNNEEIAIHSLNFIQNIDLPSDILNLILTRQPGMAISRYLQTGESVGDIDDENRSMSKELKDFIMSKCAYRSLSVLSKRHPANIQIDESILLQEKIEAEETLLKYCTLNGIDIESINLYDLKNYIKSENLTIKSEYPIPPLEAVERLI